MSDRGYGYWKYRNSWGTCIEDSDENPEWEEIDENGFAYAEVAFPTAQDVVLVNDFGESTDFSAEENSIVYGHSNDLPNTHYVEPIFGDAYLNGIKKARGKGKKASKRHS